jgi:hypothetical protein
VLGGRALIRAVCGLGRLLDERQAAVGRTGSARSLAGREQPAASGVRLRREVRRPLECERGGGVGSAGRRVAPQPFEPARDALVGPDCGRRQMPHTALTAERTGERGVRVATLGCRRALIHRSANERMCKGHALGRQPHEAARLRVGEPSNVRPGPTAGGRDHRQVPVGVHRGNHERLPRCGLERIDAGGERVLEATVRRQRQLESRDACALLGRQRRRQLDERQRIARGRVGDRRRDRGREPRCPPPQELGRLGVVERRDGKLRQTDRLRIPRIARRQHDRQPPARAARDVFDAFA